MYPAVPAPPIYIQRTPSAQILYTIYTIITLYYLLCSAHRIANSTRDWSQGVFYVQLQCIGLSSYEPRFESLLYSINMYIPLNTLLVI